MAGIRMENKIYEVGMYCRLSKDDGTDNESASIATQKSILTDYVKKQGWHLAKTYVDDGYSGTNFQRPSFQNMIKDIESGLINCVITKDLSRLGRNYLDCGLYLEVFFPEHNVRYIAVNDGVDTLNKSAMDITPFRNILNEMYSADVSVKIKSAYRARFQQGKFMGTTAPYGYVKDPADHNHLLIDDKVAHVVREIFDLALAGNGIAKIRKHINKQHILRPAAYAAEQGATGYERYFEENEENRYIWSENSVRGILRSPIYAGNLAGYKRIAANMKSKKRPSKLPEEWEVIPDTHEGIVTQEEFDTVQQLITSRRLPENKGGFENIFAGVIKCADCGYAMRAMSANRRKRPDIIDCVQYSCNNYGRYGNIMCTAHSIEARDLFNAVLTDINRFADMAVNDEKAVRAIEKRLTETDQSKAKALEKEQRKLNKRLAELDRLFSSLYEDKVMERITERNFEMMSGKYQKEQLEIEARLKEVTETLSDSYEKTQGVRDFLSLIRNYQGIKELDATIINALIDKILVSEREKLTDGMVRQEIKIYYKFIGFVGELHITPTKRWTALKPKNCTVCGVEYVPRSGISKYCPACAKKIQREKSNESKRRSRERNRQACIELSAKNDRLSRISEYVAERELSVMNMMLKSQYEQYRNYQDSLDLIQMKYHDLKHQITGLRAESDEEKRKKWIDSMEKEIAAFENISRTGNHVLDTILAAKIFHCRKNHIQITCVADGKLLDYMHVTDICSIFGNALDNAIEHVIMIPDPKKRLIHLTLCAQKGFVFIKIENYCEAEIYKNEENLIATTKTDSKNHGFGLKSIRAAVEKYDGSVAFGVQQNWFELKILLPRVL